MQTKLSSIKEFTSQKHIAIAGVSRNPKKFGSYVYDQLKEKEYNVYPIHPELDEYKGDACYRSVEDLPQEVTALHVCIPADKTPDIVKQAIDKGIANVWIQQGATNPEARAIANDNNLNLIDGKCIMMFAEPVSSIHKFHKVLMKLFGRHPR